MEHLEVRQKLLHVAFSTLFLIGPSSGDETLHLMLDILLEETNTAICISIS